MRVSDWSSDVCSSDLEAVIEDFGTGDDGLLTLQVRGARRFHVERVRVRDSGLQVASVAWCEPDRDDPLRPEHGRLSTILRRQEERRVGKEGFMAWRSRWSPVR